MEKVKRTSFDKTTSEIHDGGTVTPDSFVNPTIELSSDPDIAMKDHHRMVADVIDAQNKTKFVPNDTPTFRRE